MKSHLQQVNQTYFQHFKHSIYYSGQSLKATFFFLIHAIFPDVFVDNGSTTIAELNTTISQNKPKETV